MAKDPGIGFKILATVTGVKGHCNAGHQEGEEFGISCHNPPRFTFRIIHIYIHVNMVFHPE
jgi:hypothetical protein